MAIPPLLKLAYPAYHTVAFHGVPMFRAQAWALFDYEIHGGHLIVNSADRRDEVLRKFNRKYHTNLHGQQYLFDHQHEPGFFPANPPSETSHCLYSDGNPAYRVHGVQIRAGERLPDYMLGIDATNVPGGDASHIVSWLNTHGYRAVRPYNTPFERHHLVFIESPASNARKRLAAHFIGRKHKR